MAKETRRLMFEDEVRRIGVGAFAEGDVIPSQMAAAQQARQQAHQQGGQQARQQSGPPTAQLAKPRS